MTPRQLNQWVADVRTRAGSAQRVLDACHRAMRELRGLPISGISASDFELNGELTPAAELVLQQDDALGRIYQSLNAPALEASYRATTRERRKFKDSEIPAVTQLFTPRWVVEFLLHNTLGRRWLDWHPDSSIKLPWLVKREEPNCEPFRTASTIRILDPACGTMNFGLVAGEMLREMYREEMDRAGRNGWPCEPSVRDERDIGPAIASRNLAGVDIDRIALQLAEATMEMSGLPGCRLIQADALLGVTIGDADVVVTNPPYLSARNLPKERVTELKKRYPRAWRDAYACFIERCLELCRPDGRVGMLTMHSFMFTGAFDALRRRMCEEATIETIAHFGGGLFGIGNPGTLQTVAFTGRKSREDATRLSSSKSSDCVAIRLVEAGSKQEGLREAIDEPSKRYRLSQADLQSLPRGAWSYWMPSSARAAWHTMPTLGDIAPPRQGLATTDNARFVRYWWEVEGASPQKWRPYAKAGQFRRWYQRPMHCVNWQNDGAEIKQSICDRYPYLKGKWQWVAKNSEYYGRPGITYSYLTSGNFSARLMPEGSLFDVAGSALFPGDPLTMLAILNSSAARELLHAINPTVNFQVGDLRLLPIPREPDERLRHHVSRAIELQKRLDQFDETTPDFVAPMPWESAAELHRSMYESLRRTETEIDTIVAQHYGMSSQYEGMIPAFEPVDLARRWVSVAVRRLLTRVQVADPACEQT
ncbi:MAG TPA: N-6 DNA methylase, partial [Tepidisphaeraceae bacterium]|nr:N-6 DNA methylase [Tepidisphaeraceae bacterium]